MSEPRESAQANGLEKPVRSGKQRVRRVLLVDATTDLRCVLERCQAEHGKVNVVYASTTDQARKKIDQAGRIDLAVLCPTAEDQSVMALADELKARDTATASVVVSPAADFALAQLAMQSGALDLIVRDQAQVSDTDWQANTTSRVTAALNRQWAERMRSARIRKLKRLCRRLNDARLEVTEQVDVLCNDLVTAYQELAVQMQNITQTNGYQEAIGEELDLEALLRKTLEYLIQQAGPCNAAVFLPSSADEFALGGYVNYDCTKESADMLLEHLADVLAPSIAQQEVPLIHATTNNELDELLGDDWNYLADCHMVALPANHDGEALAVLTLFRDRDQPFSHEAIEALSVIAEQMGELLGRIIRVHHRAVPGFDEENYDSTTPSDTYLPPSEWDGYDDQAEPFDEEGDDYSF